jgi:hypothetical protein
VQFLDSLIPPLCSETVPWVDEMGSSKLPELSLCQDQKKKKKQKKKTKTKKTRTGYINLWWVSNQVACQRACANVTVCKGFNFHAADGSCALVSWMGDAKFNNTPGYTSALKALTDPGPWNLNGEQLNATFNTTLVHPSPCRKCPPVSPFSSLFLQSSPSMARLLCSSILGAYQARHTGCA